MTAKPQLQNETQIAEKQTFLQTLFKNKPDSQAVLIWTKRDKRSKYFASPNKATEYAIAQSKFGDVYFGVCTISDVFANDKKNSKRRADSSEVVGCPALYLDIDYGASHKKKNLPLKEQDAMALIGQMPTPPTFIINSGNGLHAYWMFDTIVLLTNDEIRATMQKLSEDWNRLLIAKGKDFGGYSMDSVFDLARVLRIPETLNHKSDPPKPVTLIDRSGITYTPQLLRDFLNGYVVTSPTKPSSFNAKSNAYNFVLSKNPKLNTEKWQVLCQEKPLAKQSWTRTALKGKNWSASEWDLSLASYAAQAMWTDQEIVDLLISSRIKHKDDLKLRKDYYAKTLAKARSTPVESDENSLLFNAAQLNTEKSSKETVTMQLPLPIKNNPVRNSDNNNVESIEIKNEIIELSVPEKLKPQKSEQQQFPQMEEKAFYGLAGDLVRLIEPHSEADPVALLAQTLVAFGSMIGRNAHTVAEADLHYTNLNIVLVGESSKARKGTSWGQVRTRLETIDSTWKERIMSGLSSGEGMIWQVRDEIKKREKKVEKGVVTYEEVVADPGIDDKRLTIFESEFANVLNMLQREGNSLSALIRNAWDTGNLSTLVKNAPAKATDAHISIIGHITRDELLRKLQATEQANGFANRFLWLSVKRSKMLPLGGQLHTVDFAQVMSRLSKAAEVAYSIGKLEFDREAIQLWCDVYPELSEGKAGMLGAITSRGEAQTMRLSSVYALLDSSRIIRREHLEAALAFWKYAEDSAAFIFGNALGDPVADEIMRSLHETKETGLTRTQIRDLFNRHNISDVQRALNSLIQRGLLRVEKEETGGRPSERFFYVNDV